MKTSLFCAAITHACLLCMLGLPRASAHFPWILPPQGGSNEFSVVFSEDMQPDDPELLDPLLEHRVRLYDGRGEVRRVALRLRDDRLVGEIPERFDVAVIEMPFTWGILTRRDETFLLRYRAIAVIDIARASQIKLDDRGRVGPLIRVSQSGDAYTLNATHRGRALRETPVHIFGPANDQQATDTSGTIRWQPAAAGTYGLLVKAVSGQPGRWDEMPYSELRSFTTVTLFVQR